MAGDALQTAAASHPDAPAVVTEARVVTYAELDRAAWGVADLILSSGAAGDAPISFWGERTIDAVAAAWGIPRSGGTAVPVDPRLAPGAAMETTRQVGVRGLWTPPDGGFESLIARGTREAGVPLGDYIVFTSGSEGSPRGVRITQENVAASVSASRQRLGNRFGDAWLCVLPMHHVGGLAILWRQADTASPLVLHERFDGGAASAALHQVSFASVVPVMLRRLLDVGVARFPDPIVLVGGAAAGRPLLERARGSGLNAIPTYGMTETTSQIATPRPTDPLDGTVGTAVAGGEVRVIADGVPVVDAAGRIEVRGPMVSPGYAGSKPRPDGAWLTTGDIGTISDAGRLQVLGRADRVIVTGGENVHPAAVEGALLGQPGVSAIRVRGEPDPEWGAIVAAEVVTDLSQEDLDTLARAVLAPPMRPRRWRIVTEMDDKLAD